jgi:saccharopine dehydrogenase-like NADP-dependent oxidoreductase
MKTIVLFGAGKSATVLIDYLKNLPSENDVHVIVADSNLEVVQSKVGMHQLIKAVQADITNATERKHFIQQADVVISLMPPALHHLIALDCIEFSKHLLTASYVSDEIKKLQKDILAKNILFLCEMGLDPGIDHMSAMKLIHEIKNSGGNITSFRSHCGGLVAPESDDNPWHYKISWNPRNVVLAGKAGAIYKENGNEINKSYEELFTENSFIEIPDLGNLAFYPNRDSLSYIPVYKLGTAQTFLRTTLRYPEFCFGWKNIIDLKLTDEEKDFDTTGMSIAAFFKQHFDKHGFNDWLNNLLINKLSYAKDMMEKLTQLTEAEEREKNESEKERDDSYEDDLITDDILMVNDRGELDSLNVSDVKYKAAESVAMKMHEANISMKQLFFLGLEDEETMINLGVCSTADVLQFILEKKLVLQPEDKDMIVMMHEIEYEVNNKKYEVRSFLVVKGEDSLRTAMAKTVGLPLGIAAKLILEGKIKETGLHIPIISAIYEPVLHELENKGIVFHEERKSKNV